MANRIVLNHISCCGEGAVGKAMDWKGIDRMGDMKKIKTLYKSMM